MQKKIYFLFFLSIFFFSEVSAQTVYLPLNQDYNLNLQKNLYTPSHRFHTSVRPYYLPEIKDVVNYDSIRSLLHMQRSYEKRWKQKAWDKLFNNNVVSLYRKSFSLIANPLINFGLGRSLIENKTTWVNTRGVEVRGTIGNHFTFYTSIYENQAVFPDYVDAFVRTHKIVPGQGRVQVLLDNTGEHFYLNGSGFDFNNATAYISWNAGKHFAFQFGHGKNFYGDGYRSLLLSDNATDNLFFKTTLNFWHFKYQVLYNQYIDLRDSTLTTGYARKYSVVHYLSWAVSKRVSLSFFDAIVWQNRDNKGNYRGFDIQYLNPFIFLRSADFSLGSPDNALLGANFSVIVGKHNVFYGQVLIDEFVLSKVLAGKGYWNNKQGFQIGFKSFDALKVKNLFLQTEFNYVPPYTYSEQFERINYGHDNQSLAHPFGANFWESVNFVKYSYKRLFFKYELLYSLYGEDPPGKNFGKDIYKSYNTREKEYGNYIGQGITTHLLYQDISASFLINPTYNLNFTIGFVYRNAKTDSGSANTHYIYIGLRTSLRNLYYDF